MDWKEWFKDWPYKYYYGTCSANKEIKDTYEYFVARWNEEEYPKLKARLIEDLQASGELKKSWYPPTWSEGEKGLKIKDYAYPEGDSRRYEEERDE